MLASLRASGRRLLNEVESKAVLAEAGIPVTPTRLARSRDEALELARSLGFPAALKVVAEAITHKSDIGGVRLNLPDEESVGAAFDEIQAAARRAHPDAPIDGVSVQPMAQPGVEVMIGLARDPQFGPVLMFGLGGVLVEVLQDVAVRLAPLESRDAEAMIREIQGFPVLQGYRGTPPVDLSALQSILLALSGFALEHPEVSELDLNPVIATAAGATAVDARIVLS